MECLQYLTQINMTKKWLEVLNLVINGMPSILMENLVDFLKENSFKPCYKWNAFNTCRSVNKEEDK